MIIKNLNFEEVYSILFRINFLFLKKEIMLNYILISSQKKFFLILLLFFSITVCTSQNYSEDENNDNIEAELEDNNLPINVPIVFNLLGIDNTTNSISDNINGNSVFLQQIGDFNNVNVAVIANSSDIGIVQNGNANNTFLDYQVNTVFTDILQNGNDNNIIDFVTNPQEDISLELQQQGNYLSFERYGSNNLTRSLKFTQTEASPTIIIRSFN